MRLDFNTKETGHFKIEVPDDKNLYLLSGGCIPQKEMIEKNVADYYRHDGCKIGTRSISDVSFDEAISRFKRTIDNEGERKALYKLYQYAEMSQGSDLSIYNLNYEYNYLLDENKEQDTEEAELY